jgi:serine phosphatase RsbU (regulator of sigma subunit)
VIERVLARNRMIREAIGSRLDEAITNTLRARIPARIGQWTAVLHSQPGGPGGGDFVYFRESTACSWLLLGDVMGHGVDAKFFAHAYAGHISGLAATMSDSAMPSDWLRGMSRSLAEDRLLERCLMTCLVLRIEHDGTVWAASAGHPSPLLCRAGVIVERVTGGPLLGLDPAAVYEDERIEPGPGRLVLTTDGLLEIGDDPAGRTATQRAVYETIAASATLPPHDALAAILATAVAQPSTAPRDDMTVLMLDFGPDH